VGEPHLPPVRPPRVFIGFTEVAGYFGNLQSALRSLGIRADFVDESHHAFQYRRPSLLAVLANFIHTALRRSAETRNRPTAAAWWVAALPLRGAKAIVHCWLFAAALARYDAFIFCGGDSLLPRNADLPLLRRLGKRVIWVFTGSDHRPPYLDGIAVRRYRNDIASLIVEAGRVKARVSRAEQHADWVVALPASSQFHSRPFVNFLRMGIPFVLDQRLVVGANPFSGDGTRILHAPSEPGSKGTRWVRDCVQELRAKGYALDYVELSGCPHAEILAAIANCDLVIDDVFSDTPMAVLACEAAALGKPTVVTGYYADLIRDELPTAWIPPTMFEAPSQLAVAVEQLVADEARRAELGSRARRFVEEQWSPRAVAERFLRLIAGDVPGDWVVSSRDVQYLHGGGLTKRQVSETVRHVVAAGSDAALLLDHNPLLKEKLLRFAVPHVVP